MRIMQSGRLKHCYIITCKYVLWFVFHFFIVFWFCILNLFWCLPRLPIFGSHFKILKYYVMQQTRKKFLVKIILVVCIHLYAFTKWLPWFWILFWIIPLLNDHFNITTVTLPELLPWKAGGIEPTLARHCWKSWLCWCCLWKEMFLYTELKAFVKSTEF